MSGGKKNIASILKHRLTLQEQVLTPDGAGGFSQYWQDVSDLWAEISAVNDRSIYGSEKFVSGKIQAEISHKVLIRYRSNISTEMRLIFEGRILNILALRNVYEKDDVLELLVEEIIS